MARKAPPKKETKKPKMASKKAMLFGAKQPTKAMPVPAMKGRKPKMVPDLDNDGD